MTFPGRTAPFIDAPVGSPLVVTGSTGVAPLSLPVQVALVDGKIVLPSVSFFTPWFLTDVAGVGILDVFTPPLLIGTGDFVSVGVQSYYASGITGPLEFSHVGTVNIVDDEIVTVSNVISYDPLPSGSSQLLIASDGSKLWASTDLLLVRIDPASPPKFGTDLVITAGPDGSNYMTVTSASAQFSAGMVNQYISIAGAAPANNGAFLVTVYVSTTSIKYLNAAGVVAAGPYPWSVNVAVPHTHVTGGRIVINGSISRGFLAEFTVGDIARFTLADPPVIDATAALGVQVETICAGAGANSGKFFASTGQNINRVNNDLVTGGASQAFVEAQYLLALGYDTVSNKLIATGVTAGENFVVLRIDPVTLAVEAAVEIGPSIRFGTTATIASVSSSFVSITGLTGILPEHDGRIIKFTGAFDAGNNKTLVIAQVVSATEVIVWNLGTPVFPDANSGSISWILLGNNAGITDLTSVAAPFQVKFIGGEALVTNPNVESYTALQSKPTGVGGWGAAAYQFDAASGALLQADTDGSEVSGGTTFTSAAADFALAGVLPGDQLVVVDPGLSAFGPWATATLVYEIATVGTTTLTITGDVFPATQSTLVYKVYRPIVLSSFPTPGPKLIGYEDQNWHRFDPDFSLHGPLAVLGDGEYFAFYRQTGSTMDLRYFIYKGSTTVLDGSVTFAPLPDGFVVDITKAPKMPLFGPCVIGNGFGSVIYPGFSIPVSLIFGIPFVPVPLSTFLTVAGDFFEMEFSVPLSLT